MARYWVCKNAKCTDFDGDVSSSDSPELAVCGTCGTSLTELGGDVPEEEARMVEKWADGTLARGWVAVKTAREDATAIEVEIRKRHGAVKIIEWVEDQLLNHPAGMGYEKDPYSVE